MKALRELLENSPGLFELNMGLSIAQGLQKTSGKLETDRKQIETDDFLKKEKSMAEQLRKLMVTESDLLGLILKAQNLASTSY